MIVIAGVEFDEKSQIEYALTHASFSKNNYERLEFLGDSILDFVAGDYLFRKTNQNEGLLTKIRSFYVGETHLKQVFDNLNLSIKMKIGKSLKTISSSIKCDVVEAIIAVIYLEKGLDVCTKFIQDNILNVDFLDSDIYDSKSRLQEFAQNKKQVVVYELVSQSGPDNNPVFEVKASVENDFCIASSYSKNSAEQKAAGKLLNLLNGSN